MPQRNNVQHTTYRFEWDENKNQQNIKKHGFDFVDAERMFDGIFLFRSDTRKDYGENRSIGIGAIRGRIAVVVFTERDTETIRIISLRKATRRERKEYEKAVQNELEAG
ncbi:MAG: BrnT family toxin [Acidobacteriia bacterium]|nr:BrnT family toxin [Terriglobia bacterium]